MARHVRSILDWLPQYRLRSRLYQSIPFRQLQWLVDSDEYDWMVYGVPPSSDNVLAARASREDQVSITPGSFLWGFTGDSAHFDGFRFSLWDQGAGRSMSISMTNNAAAAGTYDPGLAPTPQPRGPFFLPNIYAVGPPGLLNIRLVNLAEVANTIQLALHFARKREGAVCGP